MKKYLLKSALVAVAGMSLLAGSAWANILNDNRPITVGNTTDSTTLEGALSSISGNTVHVADQSSTAVWTPSFDGDVSAYRILGYSDAKLNLGIYSYKTGQEISFALTAINGSASMSWQNGDDLVISDANGENEYDDFGTLFGFFLTATSSSGKVYTFYTEDDKNYQNTARALSFDLADGTDLNWITPAGNSKKIFTTGDDWLLAWNDGIDYDFNDALFLIEDVNTAPVPEPATMLLMGSGLAGLIGSVRRRKNSK